MTAREALFTLRDAVDPLLEELRTALDGPVAAIARGLEQLDRDAQTLSADQQHLVSSLLRSMQSLQATVDGFAEVVGIVANGLTDPVADEIDPGAVLRQQVQLRGDRALTQGTTMRADISAAVPRSADIDADGVERIIGSMLDHALIRSADGRVVAEMDFSPNPAPGMLLMRFTWRARPLEDEQHAVTPHGLGLAVSGRQIARLGGSLGETSGADDGLWVKLPLMTPPAASEPGPRGPQPMVVLVVEDDPFSRMMAELQVELAGHLPLPAEDRESAEEELPRADLVLMDRNLGQLDATDFVRAIRTSSAPWSQVPIIGVSASAVEQDRRECLAAGMDDYIVKPVNAEQLRATVARLIETGRLPDRRLLESSGEDAPIRATVPGPGSDVVNAVVEHLHGLGRELGNPETVENIATRFLQELPNRLGTLAVAALQRDLRGFAHVAHRFRGAAAVIGAGALVATLDRASEVADVIDLARLAESVRQEAMVVRVALRRYLDETGSLS